MTTKQLSHGTVTYSQCERLVELAQKWLLEYFSDGVARRSGDLEDDFAGAPDMSSLFTFGLLAAWRRTPFFPALGILIDQGKLVHETDPEGVQWYAMPGCLPSNAVCINPQTR